MRNKQARWLTAVLATLLIAAAALGQDNPAVLRVDIPFPFVVAGQTLPAGHYVVSNTGEKILHIVNSQNQGAFVPTFQADGRFPEGSGKLVFHRYQHSYFLSQVWGTSGRQGKQLLKSPAEKEWASKGANQEIAVLQTAN